MPALRAKPFLDKWKKLKTKKEPWLQHFQVLGETFNTRKSDFTDPASPGDFLQDNVFDGTPQHAATTFKSVLLSMLWPDAARTFKLMPSRPLRGLAQVDEYFRAKTNAMHEFMDESDAGLTLTLDEHFGDQGVFGTSGIATFDNSEEDPDVPLVYEAWDVKAMVIAQNSRGFVDTIYWMEEKTARQIMEEYGSKKKKGDKVSEKLRDMAKNKPDEKVELLRVIEPKKAEKGKAGVAGMPFLSAHIDATHKFVMRESGFEEMPVAVVRMFKRVSEVYGRSPAMIALPAAISLNALSEGVLVATEKQLDPPLAVLDDGRLGGGVIDTSASAINVFSRAGMLGNEKPIFPLFTVGEMQSAEKLEGRLTDQIMQSFLLDRLLDLNNKTMMTAFEASIRNRLRGEASGSVFMRQMVEGITPTVRRSYNILFRRGYFGDFDGIGEDEPGVVRRRRWKSITGNDPLQVPNEVRKAHEAGLPLYEIHYTSPARRFMQSEKLQGIFTVMDTLLAAAPAFPNMIHAVDERILIEQVYSLGGAPVDSLRTLDDYNKAIAAAAERANAQAALVAGKDVAQIQRDSAQARSTLGTARRA